MIGELIVAGLADAYGSRNKGLILSQECVATSSEPDLSLGSIPFRRAATPGANGESACPVIPWIAARLNQADNKLVIAASGCGHRWLYRMKSCSPPFHGDESRASIMVTGTTFKEVCLL